MNNSAIYSLSEAGGVHYTDVESYEFENWYSTVGLTDYGAYRTIRFSMRQENLILHWKNSYLEIHGQLLKRTGDDVQFGADDKIALIFNAIFHLFTNAKISIGTQTVENVNLVGYVSSMIHYVLFPRSKGKSGGLQYLWVPDRDKNANVENAGFKIRRQYLLGDSLPVGKKGLFKFRIPGKPFNEYALSVGAYGLNSIYQHLVEYFETNHPGIQDVEDRFKLIGDEATSKSIIIIKKGIGIDFNVENSIHQLLGFTKQDVLLKEGRYISENTVNITDVTQLIFCCHIIESNYISDLQIPFLFNSTILVPPGYRMSRELAKITYKKLNSKQICTIKVWLIDENGNKINLRKEKLIVTISLKLQKDE